MLITAADVLLLLALTGTRFRLLELVTFILSMTIAACFVVELINAKPDWLKVMEVSPCACTGTVFLTVQVYMRGACRGECGSFGVGCRQLFVIFVCCLA